jgi:hypothetical protein
MADADVLGQQVMGSEGRWFMLVEKISIDVRQPGVDS